MGGTGKILIMLLISAQAGFVQRVSGFGFGIFIMLFLPYLMETHSQAAAVSTLVSCIISVYNAILYRKKIPYKSILPLLVGALLFIPIAVRFSVLISGDFFKKLLGIVLISLSIYFLFINRRIVIKPSFKNGLISGGIGGTLTGLFSTGGPPIVLYLMHALTDNTVYFASTQFYFGLTGIYATLVRFFNGIITKEVLVFTGIGFLGSLIGNFAGKYVFDKLNAERLRQIIYIGMIISGILMIVPKA